MTLGIEKQTAVVVGSLKDSLFEAIPVSFFSCELLTLEMEGWERVALVDHLQEKQTGYGKLDIGL